MQGNQKSCGRGEKHGYSPVRIASGGGGGGGGGLLLD